MLDSPHRASAISRTLGWLVVATSVLYLVFLFPTPENPVLNKDDGSLFLTLGINLAELSRYSMDTMAAEHIGRHATWPPAFPLFLAAITAVAGVAWPAIKLGMVALGLAFLFVLWRLIGAMTEGKTAVLLTALSPYFFLYSHHTMAEVPYMLGVAATLLAIDRADSPAKAALAGLLGAVAFLTRGYAAVLLPTGLVFFLAMRRQLAFPRRVSLALAFALPLAVAIAGWSIYTQLAIASGFIDGFTVRYGSGTSLLAGALRPPLEQLKQLYWADLRYPAFLMLPIFELRSLQDGDLVIVLTLGLLALAGLGWWTSLRQAASSVPVWLFFALAMLLAQETRAARYWLPLMPFLFYFVLRGATTATGALPGRKWLMAGFALVLVVVSATGLARHLLAPDALRYYDRFAVDSRDVVLWARQALPPDAVVITEAPEDVYVGARRRALSLRADGSVAKARSLPGATHVFLLCPSSADTKAHYPDTYSRCQRLLGKTDSTLVRETPTVRLYEVR